jgi:hypothetical protein
MAAEKLPVFIDKFTLSKPFDAKAAKGAPDTVAATLAKAFGGAFEVVKSAPKGNGFDISGAIQKLEYDEKKKSISANLSVVMATTPGRSMFGNVSASGAVDGVNPKKLEAAIDDLMTALAEDAGGKAAKAMEKKAKDLWG